MGSKNRSAARFRICSGHRSDSRAGGSGGWKAAGTNEERKRRAGVHFPGRHLLLASCRSGTRFSGGARRASSSLVPRLAPRGFPVRRGWRGGERQGWRVSAVRKGGGCAECEKGHGRGRVTFPPLGSVLTSHRSDSRSGTKWWGAASLPRVDQVPGSAGMVGRERDAKRHGHRAWAAVCAGERTDDGAGHSPPRRSGSRFSGDGGAGAGCKKARAQGMGGGVRWRAHGVAGQEKTGVRWRAHGAAGRASSPHVDRAPGSARGGGARKGRGAGRPG